jgi:hypothetical protein
MHRLQLEAEKQDPTPNVRPANSMRLSLVKWLFLGFPKLVCTIVYHTLFRSFESIHPLRWQYFLLLFGDKCVTTMAMIGLDYFLFQEPFVQI